MSNRALVLAAHGSRHEPCVNEAIVALTREVEARVDFDEVACAFHQGSPRYCEVLDGLAAEEVVVVPVMASAGWYSDTVLPRELAQNRRFPLAVVRQARPVGLHPRISSLVRGRIAGLFAKYGLSPDETTIALVGHGTPRHPASRNSTFALVEQLRASAEFGEVIAAFLDDDPLVDLLPGLARREAVVVIPFLIAAGPHATRDLPQRIGLSAGSLDALPIAGNVLEKRVVYDIPFGAYPEMAELIADMATSSHGAAMHSRSVEQRLA